MTTGESVPNSLPGRKTSSEPLPQAISKSDFHDDNRPDEINRIGVLANQRVIASTDRNDLTLASTAFEMGRVRNSEIAGNTIFHDPVPLDDSLRSSVRPFGLQQVARTNSGSSNDDSKTDASGSSTSQQKPETDQFASRGKPSVFRRRFLLMDAPADTSSSQADKDGQSSTSGQSGQSVVEGSAGVRSGFIAPPVKGNVIRLEEMPLWLSAHGQATIVSQVHDRFTSPYLGSNSLKPIEGSATSETSTMFLDAALWKGGDIILNPEVAGGIGFSGVTGLAGFSNGEITRVGVPQPTPYIARMLFRQLWGFGGDTETVEEGANQVAMTRDVRRVTVYVGKMALTDIFDNNRHSHDPRTQLMNWSMMYNGAWDFPADVRGYDYGMAVDYNEKNWAVRYGIFGEPVTANGTNIDSHVLKAYGQAWEFEQRTVFNQRPGAIRLLAFLNRAHMGNYRDALAAMPVDPDVTQTRGDRIKYGFGYNMEQDVTQDLGIWARAGWNDGQTESWAFTEIDNTIAIGLLLTGDRWKRPQDEVGLGLSSNGLSAAHRDYLAAGGLGFIIGDGRLNYAREEIIETYYNLKVTNTMSVTGDIQGVNNPAYNHDRGPVVIAGLRVHFDF